MTDAIGTARLDIVVDTSQFDNAIASAKGRLSGMSTAAQQEYEKLNAAEKRRVNSLLTQADLLGKTRAEQIAYNAALKGLPTAVVDDLVRKLARAEQATKSGEISAKQYQAALRGVPAQFTDIITSLQGGQAPLTVLFQQGGQLKDMFGGIKPAAAALGAEIAALVNPITIAGAGMAAFALAAYKGSQESNAFAQALAITGNVAGVTVDDMRNLQLAIAGGAVTQGAAAEALVEVAKSGKFAADQFRAVAETAAVMEAATGQSIETTVQQFASLARDPVAAVVKLNESTHFLTAEIYDQVAALQAQGREQDAATVAMEGYAAAMQQRAEEVSESVGFLQRRWRELETGAKAAWDAMLGVGRDSSLDEQIGQQTAKIAELRRKQRPGYSLFDYTDEIKQAEAERTRLIRQQAEQNRQEAAKAAEQGANDTYIALQQASRKLEPRLVQLQRERAEIIAKAARGATDAMQGEGGLALNQKIRDAERAALANIDREIAEERKKGQKKPPSTRSIDRADLQADLQAVKDQLAQEQAATANSRRVTEAEYGAKLITVEEYYARTRKAIADDTAAQEKALQAQIAILRERGGTGADSINNARQAAQLEAQLAKLRQDGATALQVLGIQEGEVARQREQAFKAYKDGLEASNDALRKNYAAELARLTLGNRAFEYYQRLTEVQNTYAQQLARLNEQRDSKAIDAAEYARRLRELQQNYDAQVRIVQEGEAAKAAAQANWQNGANRALQNYLDAARDVAGQTESVFSNAFKGLEDVMVQFATTGKANFSDFVNSILADITRMMTQKAVGQFVQMLFGAFGGTGVTRESIDFTAGSQVSDINFFGGNRAIGGPVSSGKLYEVGEGGRPEIFQQGGRTYLIPGNAGTVVPAAASVGQLAPPAGSGSAGAPVEIVVNNYGNPERVSAREERQQMPNGDVMRKFVIDILADDMASGGKTATVLKGRFGLREQI